MLIMLNTVVFGDNGNNKYQMWSDYQIKSSSLRGLIVHRAEVYASKGYIFKDTYLKKQMKKRYWYKPSKSYSFNQFSKKEKKYINKLTKRITYLKKELLSTNQDRLQRYLLNRENMTIKFSQLVDINGDGQYDLVSICGKKYKIRSGQLQDETYKHYYNKSNELYLIVWGDSIYGTFYSKTKISAKPFGIAEYVNQLKIGYYMGNGKPQIKVVIHSFPLKNYPDTSHSQTLYIYSFDNKKLKNVFAYETYRNNIIGNQERTIRYHCEFKNIKGNKLNEIVLKKEVRITDYHPQSTYSKNYSEKIYRSQPLYFKYDMLRKIYIK